MVINYVTNAELCNIVRNNLHKIPHDIDGVIGIPRGGMFIATIISEYFNIPLYSVESFLFGSSIGSGEAGKTMKKSSHGKYLVVDDSASSGKSFKNIRAIFAERSEKFVYVAAVCDDRKNLDCVDIVLSYVRELRIFELNLFRIPFIRSSIIDFDGVLCENPPKDIDKDEEKYIEFMKTAKPMFPLCYPPLAICTGRLLKYSKETISWLRERGISYGKLYMLDIPSIEEKLEKMNTPSVKNMKATVYKKHKEAALFIESDKIEAMHIYNCTGRPVLCIGNNTLYQNQK